MLSEQTIKMIEELKALEARIMERVSEETNDTFAFCAMPYFQMWADTAFVHDMADVVDKLGPLTKKYVDEEDNRACYEYHLGSAHGVILLPIDMSDSRSESDDVRVNQEA